MKIVHGSYVDLDSLLMSEFKHCRFFDVGRDFFRDTLYRIVDLNGYISISDKYKDYRFTEFVNRIKPNHEKLEELVKRKDVFSFVALKNNEKLYDELIALIDSIIITDSSMKQNYF